MKPFDLEAAQRGDKLITRAGEEAEFIAYVPKAGKYYQVLALSGSMPKTYDTEGRFLQGSESTYDLFMAPKKRTIWLNIYPNQTAQHYNAKQTADAWAGERLGNRAYPLEIEE
jgi:uncharacterized alpha/beta hydrolase family protein